MDKIYRSIIFATDLGPQSLYIGQHAVKINALCNAQLFALHVVEPPMTHAKDFHERDALLSKSVESATKSLAALCQQLNVANMTQIVKVGSPQDEILTTSAHHQCDLIIVGSHGIGGYTHALGSTTHYLLNESHCDVLTVQVTHLKDAVPAKAPPNQYLWQVFDDKKIKELNKITSKYMSSEHGFGAQVKYGPKPSMRPPGAPFKGGTRKNEDDDNDSNKD